VPSKKLPRDVIDHWPEVFNDIEVKVVPLDYLDSIHVSFDNNDTWVIEFDKNTELTSASVSDSLTQLFREYEDQIVNVDFRLDTQKVKQDVQKRTRQFLKKRK